ncbi:MAG TPA: DUF1822 family protein, partial [Allocoleopsis sp.]
MNNTTLEIAYAVPLNQSFHETALKFAKEQNTTAKGKQVYLNTLAVLAVNDFVQWLHIETDLESSDSWNIVVRLFQNVADLVLPNLGTIECIPVILSENKKVISI